MRKLMKVHQKTITVIFTQAVRYDNAHVSVNGLFDTF